MALTTASNSAVQVAIQKETVWGTKIGTETPTPTVVDFKLQRFTECSFSLNRAELEDESITAARGVTSVRYGNFDAGGTISGALAATSWDDFIASACMNNWVADTIVSDGIVEQSFNVQIGHTDINQYELWTGMQVGSMTISSPVDALSNISFEFSGSTQEGIYPTSIDATPTAAASTEAMFHCGGVMNYDGNPVAIITGIEVTLENSLETQFAWGNCAARDITAGKSRVSGSFTALYADDTFQTDSLNETQVSIDFTLTDPAGNSLKFSIPSVSLGSVDAPVSGEGATVLTVPFRGVYNAGIGGTLEITRS